MAIVKTDVPQTAALCEQTILELVKTYQVELIKDGGVVAARQIEHNHQRLNVLHFDSVDCDTVKVTVLATHGCENARIFEIRVY